VLVEPESARLLHLIHSPETTPAMVALINDWRASHPESSDRREWTNWYPPESAWSLTMDAGRVADALRDKRVVHEELAGPDASTVIAGFPETFVRDPVATIIRHLAGIEWPPHLGAHVLRPRFHHARRGDTTVITGCRYGSRHADAGQDRTAAVFIERERGAGWDELPWDLPLRQRLTPSGQFCWPPEQIDRVEIVDSEGAASPRIEFDDPWIVFEPGTEWRATWMPRQRHWIMEERA
jgi:hypothetical protein